MYQVVVLDSTYYVRTIKSEQKVCLSDGLLTCPPVGLSACLFICLLATLFSIHPTIHMHPSR